MVTYKTPGVYTVEIPTLPPSVAEVSTAVPAFIGCTALSSTAPVVARIETMLEFQGKFGGAAPSGFEITTRLSAETPSVKVIDIIKRDKPDFEYLMYYSLSMYFLNGGGSCYIVSVGDYSTAPNANQFLAGIAALEKQDEPTLLVLTDAVNLNENDYYAVCEQALAHCAKMKDRFTILDVLNDAVNGVNNFRNGIGTNNLSYGAAYYPYLETTLNYVYQEDKVKLAGVITFQKSFDDNGITVQYLGATADAPKVAIATGTTAGDIAFGIAGTTLTITTDDSKTAQQVAAAWSANTTLAKGTFSIKTVGNGTGKLTTKAATALTKIDFTLAGIKSDDTSLYNQVKAALNLQRVTLPPSGAMAGIYAIIDRNKGVWKAPANVSVSSVIGPVVRITTEQQDNLNVHPDAGKSINAIRAFTGKGTLVWGARTLAGNDNEWRYVSVRRLFITIEESTQKATSFAVFESNDATTWLKVKAMIESYLFGLWGQGALAGSTAEAAYYVRVGLGKTMTPQDVLEGRMIVEIGIAAVRPAEFIILRFSHRLQQA